VSSLLWTFPAETFPLIVSGVEYALAGGHPEFLCGISPASSVLFEFKQALGVGSLHLLLVLLDACVECILQQTCDRFVLQE